MTTLTFCAALWGLFQATRILLDEGDVLRLRSMICLAAALAAISSLSVPGCCLALAIAVAACRIHPDLRPRPMAGLLLIMLTPAAVAGGVCLGITGAAVAAWSAPSPDWLPATWHLSATFGVAAIPAIGFGWRFRLFAFAGSATLAAASGAAMAGVDPAIWLLLAAPVCAAAWRAGVLHDVQAWGRAFKPAAAFVLVPALALAARAGPWTQKAGDQLLIVRAPFAGGASPGKKLSLHTYGEAGLSDSVTFVTSAYQETADRDAKMGGHAAVRALLAQSGDWAFSGEVGAGVEPFSLSTGGAWERHAEGEIRALAGWSGSLEGLPVYAAAEAGWRFRPVEFGDAALLAVSAGVDLTPALQINVHASTAIGEDGRDTRFAQAGVLWRIDDWAGLELGVQTGVDERDDLETQAFAGLWLKF